MIRNVVANQRAVRAQLKEIRGLGRMPNYYNRWVTIYVPRLTGWPSLQPFNPVTTN
jgi:hypothetical protein